MKQPKFDTTPEGALLPPAFLSQNDNASIRWPGSKHSQNRELAMMLPRQIENYAEVFAGGANLLVYLLKEGRITGTAYLSDTCELLINFYLVQQCEPERLAKAALAIHEQHGRGDREIFDEAIHTMGNPFASGLEKAVAFFVHNSLVYSLAALDFDRKTAFAQSRADTRGVTENNIRRLVANGKLLANVEIDCCDYRVAMERLPNDTVVFLDSPYEDRDEDTYLTEFFFDEFAGECVKWRERHKLMITLDSGPKNMKRLASFTQIVHPVRYHSSKKTAIEQIALSYEPVMLEKKLKLLVWDKHLSVKTPSAANENSPPAAKSQKVGEVGSVATKPSKQKKMPDRNSDQWFTPHWLLDILYAIHGIDQFDLDPCSPPEGIAHTNAKHRFCVENDQDGLQEDWKGDVVFMNPPYGRGIGKWVAKARQEVENGNAKLIIGLLPAKTDTKWWHENVAGHGGIWHLKGRLRFSDAASSGTFASALVFWGDTSLFEEAWLDGFSCLVGLEGSLEGYWVPPQPRKTGPVKINKEEIANAA